MKASLMTLEVLSEIFDVSPESKSDSTGDQ